MVRAIRTVFLLGMLPFASAQVRTTGEVRGTVTDPSNAVVPAVVLTAKDLATGNVATTASGTNGAFVLLNLLPGAYELTASAAGFQTAVFPRMVVETARTVNLNIQLSVGQVAETVEVRGVAPLLQTTTNTVATTIRNDFVQDLPLSGRDTLQFAALMAGAQTPGSDTRNSTFNGLPNASQNITVDGVNNNSQRFKTGGTSFFAFAPIRLDAIEEVTISTTGAGADASAGGAVNIRFITRRGTNQWRGRLFEQWENDALNANAFFNNARGQARSKIRRNDFGGNLGGPLPLPFTRNKLFFFVNFEAAPRPGTANRSLDVLTPAAQSGVYSYIAGDGAVRSQNVLQQAGAAGFSTRIDPTVQGILGVINGTVSKGAGTIPNVNNPNYFTLQWRQRTQNDTYYPTARLDYQISNQLAWHGSWNLRANSIADTPQYPELPDLGGGYKITTFVASNAVDWTIAPTLLNSFNFGVQGNHEDFYMKTSISQWARYGHRRLNLGSGITPVIPDQTPIIRNNPVYNFYDNLNWVKGNHTFTFGGALLRTHFYEIVWNNAGVLNHNLGVAAGDPITAALPQGLFPGIRPQDLAPAWALYATLTGRISGIDGSRNVDEGTHQYADFAPLTNRYGFATAGFYLQDSWRLTPQLTINYGFRWELSGAIHNRNNITTPPDLANFYGPSTGLFRPGVLDGVADPQLSVRPYTYSGDKINPAPNFGFAWNPRPRDGFLGKLLGPKTVIRGSYGINYYDEGLNAFSNRVGGNPGPTQTISLLAGVGFQPGALNLSSSIPAPTVNPASFSFPLPQRLFTFTRALNTTQPVMRTPYVQNWTFGVQREVGRGMAVEARYVGNKSTHMWHAYSLNETNIFESGFLQEFQNAQRNREINAASGVNSFANRNLPGQAPLPIFEAAFGARGSQPSLPAGSGFTSGAFLNNLQLANAGAMANTLATSNIYYCRLVGNAFQPCAALGYSAPGPYPINLFRPNPFVTGLTLLDDNSYSTYHGLQIEFRKAFSRGLTLHANYTWSKTLADLFNLDDQSAADNYFTLRNRDLDKGPTPFDLRHVFQGYWTYELPLGKNKAFLKSGGALDRIAGGWKLSGIHRLHSGAVYRLTGNRNTFNNLADSGILLDGLSVSELQSMMRRHRPGPNLNAYSAEARLVGADRRANQQYLRSPSTPGEFGQIFYMYGTPLVINDLALEKVVPITERVSFNFQIEALNAFNHPVLAIGTTNIDSNAFGQTTGTIVGPRNIQIRLRIDW